MKRLFLRARKIFVFCLLVLFTVPLQEAFASSSQTCEAALSNPGERPTIVWDIGLENRPRLNWTPYVGKEVLVDYAMITPDMNVVMMEEAGVPMRGKIPLKVMKSDNVGFGDDIQAQIGALYARAKADNEVEHAFVAMRANPNEPWQFSEFIRGGGGSIDARQIDIAAEILLIMLEIQGGPFSRGTVETLMVHTHPRGGPLSLTDQIETTLFRERFGFGRVSCLAVDAFTIHFDKSISFIFSP